MRAGALTLVVAVVALAAAGCGERAGPSGGDGGVPGNCRTSPTPCPARQSCQPCWGDGGATDYVCLPDFIIC